MLKLIRRMAMAGQRSLKGENLPIIQGGEQVPHEVLNMAAEVRACT